MEIVIGAIGLVIGAIVAVIVMRSSKQGSLREADAQLESARAQASQVLTTRSARQRHLRKKLFSRLKRRLFKTSRLPRPRRSNASASFALLRIV